MADGPTDFNDLAAEQGLSMVKGALSAPAPADHGEGFGARSDSMGGRADAELKRTKDGVPLAGVFNTHVVLQQDEKWDGVLAYCLFSYRIIKRKPPPWPGATTGEWSDADTARLRLWLSQYYGFTPKSADAEEVILIVAEDNCYHPVRDYLTGINWDGKPRLGSWLKVYLGVESCAEDEAERARYEQYQSLVGAFWMVAAVARVMRPPVKADCVLILEGKQGLGKSTALNILGGDWFSDTHFALGEKDGYQQMQGLWICELAELDSFNKAESTRAKQFFGSAEDRYRPSYGRRTKAFARQCVFAGTTNQDSYLKDPTGNRRYWPVFCTKLDAEGLRRDRDQLWAEALRLYDCGYQWWVDDDQRYLFEEQQEARFSSDVWEDLITEYLRDPVSKAEYYTTNELMQNALRLEPAQMRQPEQTRVGQIMTRLKWKRSRKTITETNGKRVRKWVYERPAGWE